MSKKSVPYSIAPGAVVCSVSCVLLLLGGIRSQDAIATDLLTQPVELYVEVEFPFFSLVVLYPKFLKMSQACNV